MADDVSKETTNVRLVLELSHQAGLADCIQYLHWRFCSERGLVKGMRYKHVVGHNGLHGALYYYWKFDTEIFTLELERVELAAWLLFLAFTGARPGAIFESACKGIAGTNAALLYKDVKLRLL